MMLFKQNTASIPSRCGQRLAVQLMAICSFKIGVLHQLIQPSAHCYMKWTEFERTVLSEKAINQGNSEGALSET